MRRRSRSTGTRTATVTGEGLPVGSYTLSATAYAEADGGGAELGTLAVSFRVAAGEAVDPDALTASFEGVPEVHDGSSPFTFRVRFSQEPRVSYKVLRDESFAVTGGEVDKARRVDGRNDLREIHIEPEGWDDVAVMLAGGRACGTAGAICTADGKVLANTAVALVRGPLALSVADARIDEAANAVLAFEVTLNRAASGTVTVDYATADGTATAGSDYTAASGTLTFEAGETAKTVNVPVLDDVHDDTEETLTLVLSNAVGARIRDGEGDGDDRELGPAPAGVAGAVRSHGGGSGGGRHIGPAGGLGGERFACDAGRAAAHPRWQGRRRRRGPDLKSRRGAGPGRTMRRRTTGSRRWRTGSGAVPAAAPRRAGRRAGPATAGCTSPATTGYVSATRTAPES